MVTPKAMPDPQKERNHFHFLSRVLVVWCSIFGKLSEKILYQLMIKGRTFGCHPFPLVFCTWARKKPGSRTNECHCGNEWTHTHLPNSCSPPELSVGVSVVTEHTQTHKCTCWILKLILKHKHTRICARNKRNNRSGALVKRNRSTYTVNNNLHDQ